MTNFQDEYKPTGFNDIIMPSADAEATLRRYLPPPGGKSFGLLKPLILHGPYGTGKTTVLDLIGPMKDPTFQSANFLSVTASGRKNAKTFLSTIQRFTTTMAFGGGMKVLAFDEVDIIADELQQLLKAQITEMTNLGLDVLIVMTTNHLERVDGGIMDRSIAVDMTPTDPMRFLPHMREILIAEKVPMVTDDLLLPIAVKAGTSIRQLYNEMEIVVEGLRALQALPPPHRGLTLLHGSVTKRTRYQLCGSHF